MVLRIVIAACLLAVAGATAQEDPTASLQRLLDQEQYDEVIAQGEAALATAGGDPVVEGRILDLMASAGQSARRSREPEIQAIAIRAIETNQRAHGDSHRVVAASIERYALILAAAGDLKGSAVQHERALAMRELVLEPNDTDIAVSASNLGDVLRRLGRYDDATPYFEQALRIRQEVSGPVHAETAKVWHNMGNNYLRAGDYVEARNAYDQALTIKEQVLEPDDTSLAYTLISQGVLERTVGDFEASRAAYDRALVICESALAADHPLTLAARNNLANLLNDMGDFESAIPLYETTLALRESSLGPDHPEVAETRHSLGILLLRAGQPESAEVQLDAALAIWTASLGPDHPHLANSNESLGNIALMRGDVEAARGHANRALQIRLAALGPEHPETAKSQLQVASVHLAAGERPEALRAAQTATLALDRHSRETIAWMPERQALAMVAAQIKPEALLFAGLQSAIDDRDPWLGACWDWTLRQRGVVQEELARRMRFVLEGDTAEARSAWTAYRDARTSLAAVWVEGPGEDAAAFSENLATARATKEEAEEELARVNARFADRRSAAAIGAHELSSSLGDREALVEFVRVAPGWPPEADAPARDFALVLESTGAMDFIELGESAEIDRATREWRVTLDEAAVAAGQPWKLDAAMADLERAGRALRQLAWDPVADRLHGQDRLYVVPEGALHLVDLAALPTDDGRYLIENEITVRLLDTGRDLARFAEAPGVPAGPASVLAVGDVDFDATGVVVPLPRLLRGPRDRCRGLHELTWAPLPGSARELEALRGVVGTDLVTLTGSAATISRLSNEAAGKQVLHLATHGFFLQSQCAGIEAGVNPLLLSGLVFAGANESNRGIATAEELATLDLRGVELAVLSACDTGLGEIAVGEGVFGLRRAFDVAGTSTVVMSLWAVPDDAARAWMSHFYAALVSGSGAAEAARTASLSRLRELRAAGVVPHPELWTGFVCVGDWR